MTQPIYELAPLQRFLDRVGKPALPIILGCIPLHTSRHAEYLHNEVPGITIPEHVRERMRKAGERGPEEGQLIAQDLLAEAKDLVQGVYLLPSYHRYSVVTELTKILQTPTVAP
jgi:homocysteine S-methyltransferase